jgi:hypothetical protein
MSLPPKIDKARRLHLECVGYAYSARFHRRNVSDADFGFRFSRHSISAVGH